MHKFLYFWQLLEKHVERDSYRTRQISFSKRQLRAVLKRLKFKGLCVKQQCEMTKLCVFWRTRTTAAYFSYFHLESISAGVIQGSCTNLG